MIDERKEAQACLYVLGALPVVDAADFERLLRADLELQMLVRELRATADGMVAAFPRVQPPPELKANIMATVRGGSASRPSAVSPVDFSQWQQWVPWALAACFALLCVLLLTSSGTLRRQMTVLETKSQEAAEQMATWERDHAEAQEVVTRVITNYEHRLIETQSQLQQRTQELQQQRAAHEQQLRKNDALAQTQRRQYQRQVQDQQDLINDLQEAVAVGIGKPNSDVFSQMTIAVLAATADAGTRAFGAVAFSPQDQVGVVVADNLTPLTADRDYQLWLFDPQNPATPVSGGVFSADAQGRARFQYRTTQNLPAVGRFAVSVERKGGALQPQGRIILVSN